MAKKKLSIEDIFNDDDFGLLESEEKKSVIKTDEDRLIEAFQEINTFFKKNNREPGKTISEYSLKSRLKSIRENEEKKIILKPYDKHNLLGHVDIPKPTLDEIFNDDDLGLLEQEEDLSIYKFKHTPEVDERAETEFVARRKPLKEKEFKPYEEMFYIVHKELKEGKRELKEFKYVDQHLKEGRFYVIDGVLAYLETVNFGRENENLKQNTLRRKDGRTRTIFENGTYSNMLYRSLGKAIYNNGKMITDTDENIERDLFKNASITNSEDIESGWIYVLSSKSENHQISSIKNLYKIGFSKEKVEDRIKNASKEATYLFADVKIEASYRCYNLNTRVFENLIHRFFAESCLDIDLELKTGMRITPREWFVVPLNIIDEAIQLTINGTIINYKYDSKNQKIILRRESS